MQLNKNGCYLSIYCLRCSGGSHAEMNKEEGRGVCKFVKEYTNKGIRFCDFECKCGYYNTACNEEYVNDYAIR